MYRIKDAELRVLDSTVTLVRNLKQEHAYSCVSVASSLLKKDHQ